MTDDRLSRLEDEFRAHDRHCVERTAKHQIELVRANDRLAAVEKMQRWMLWGMGVLLIMELLADGTLLAYLIEQLAVEA